MINNPSENPNIPENLRKKINDVNNSVTLAQSELKRLRELAISETYNVDQIEKRKQYITEETEKIENNLKQLKKQEEEALNRLYIAQNSLQDALESEKVVLQQIDKEKAIVSDLKKKTEMQIDDLSVRASILLKVEQEIIEKEKFINDKKAALENALKLC